MTTTSIDSVTQNQLDLVEAIGAEGFIILITTMNCSAIVIILWGRRELVHVQYRRRD